MLSLRDVHVHIGKLHILQGVTLEVKPGECSGVARAQRRRQDHDAARASWDLSARSARLGRIRRDRAREHCRRTRSRSTGIGYVPQGRGIFPTLSVEENLYIGIPGKR